MKNKRKLFSFLVLSILLISIFAFYELSKNIAFSQECKQGKVVCPEGQKPCCEKFKPHCKDREAQCCKKKKDGSGLKCQDKDGNSYPVECKESCEEEQDKAGTDESQVTPTEEQQAETIEGEQEESSTKESHLKALTVLEVAQACNSVKSTILPTICAQQNISPNFYPNIISLPAGCIPISGYPTNDLPVPCLCCLTVEEACYSVEALIPPNVCLDVNIYPNHYPNTISLPPGCIPISGYPASNFPVPCLCCSTPPPPPPLDCRAAAGGGTGVCAVPPYIDGFYNQNGAACPGDQKPNGCCCLKPAAASCNWSAGQCLGTCPSNSGQSCLVIPNTSNPNNVDCTCAVPCGQTSGGNTVNNPPVCGGGCSSSFHTRCLPTYSPSNVTCTCIKPCNQQGSLVCSDSDAACPPIGNIQQKCLSNGNYCACGTSTTSTTSNPPTTPPTISCESLTLNTSLACSIGTECPAGKKCYLDPANSNKCTCQVPCKCNRNLFNFCGLTDCNGGGCLNGKCQFQSGGVFGWDDCICK